MTPPPEVSIHAIDAPETLPVGVQDASNQTEASEMDEELPMIEPIVKQEQTMSPCHLQTATTTTNLTNFEIVSSTPEKICNVVRITTTSVNLGKVDKAENTIINMADCTKYSIARDGRTVTSIDRTIEHVINCHEERRESFVETSEQEKRSQDEDFEEERVRTGPRIIELTEENCDSFHENLEFFSRRRDRKSYSAEDLIAQGVEKAVTENQQVFFFVFSIFSKNVNFHFSP